jgi:hypothetical protein
MLLVGPLSTRPEIISKANFCAEYLKRRSFVRNTFLCENWAFAHAKYSFVQKYDNRSCEILFLIKKSKTNFLAEYLKRRTFVQNTLLCKITAFSGIDNTGGLYATI